MSQPIGLSELIQQVKKELLAPVLDRKSDPPILFVESVELELQVTARREGNAGIKIDVLSVGGGEAGGGVSHEKAHTVKVQLSPLFDKAQLLEWYKDLYGDEIMPAVKRSMEALLKGDESNIADRY
ncbi:trypco2 family protein [Sphaerothrix gracilis]|uniref:trypco2 family protein n=1 Tax=Sphaerothrix gracilis TaxID=3151835 RepID=UPI0031FBA378